MIQFKDKDNVQRCIYIDLLVNNPDCPKEFKDNPLPPNDVDLCLITNGKQQSSQCAPLLMMAGKKEDKKKEEPEAPLPDDTKS